MAEFKYYKCDKWSPSWNGTICRAAQWDGNRGSIGEAMTLAKPMIEGGEDIVENDSGVISRVQVFPHKGNMDFCHMNKNDWIIVHYADRLVQTWSNDTFSLAWREIETVDDAYRLYC